MKASTRGGPPVARSHSSNRDASQIMNGIPLIVPFERGVLEPVFKYFVNRRLIRRVSTLISCCNLIMHSSRPSPVLKGSAANRGTCNEAAGDTKSKDFGQFWEARGISGQEIHIYIILGNV